MFKKITMKVDGQQLLVYILNNQKYDNFKLNVEVAKEQIAKNQISETNKISIDNSNKSP